MIPDLSPEARFAACTELLAIARNLIHAPNVESLLSDAAKNLRRIASRLYPRAEYDEVVQGHALVETAEETPELPKPEQTWRDRDSLLQ